MYGGVYCNNATVMESITMVSGMDWATQIQTEGYPSGGQKNPLAPARGRQTTCRYPQVRVAPSEKSPPVSEVPRTGSRPAPSHPRPEREEENSRQSEQQQSCQPHTQAAEDHHPSSRQKRHRYSNPDTQQQIPVPQQVNNLVLYLVGSSIHFLFYKII